jgi:hypothetical protein
MSLSRPSALVVAAATALLGGFLGGCGHTETHVAMLRAPEARTPHNVELYIADQAAPARPFYDIGIVQAIGFGSEANPEDVTRALTDKAATLGCDAVVRVFIDTGYSRAHAAGVCVKYLADGPPGPAAVLPPNPSRNPSPPLMRPAPSPRIEPLPSSPRQGR